MKTKYFATVCLSIILLMMGTYFAFASDSNPNNVALGKTVTDVNGVGDNTSSAAYITNGNHMDDDSTTGRFLIPSAKVLNAVFEIDLGATYKLCGADVLTGSDLGNNANVLYSYQLEYYGSDLEWYPIEIETGMQLKGKNSSNFENKRITVDTNGYTIKEITNGFNYLVFKNEIETNKIRLVSKDTSAVPKTIREILVYKALEGDEANNVAYRKPVTVSWAGMNTDSTVAQSPSFVVDGQTDNENNQDYFFTSAANSETTDHWIEIDLLKGYHLKGAQICTGRNDGSQKAASFSLQAMADGVWTDIPGTVVADNASNDVILNFPAYTADKVRLFLPMGQQYNRVREIKLFEIGEADPTNIALIYPEKYPLNTFEKNISIETKITDSGYGVKQIKVYCNNAILTQDDYTVDINEGTYVFNLKNLNLSENLIKIEIYDIDGNLSYVSANINVYDETIILDELKLCTTTDAFADTMKSFEELLQLNYEDLHDEDKWGYSYTRILGQIEQYASVSDILDDFELFNNLKVLINSDSNNIYTNAKTYFSEISWYDYEEISDKEEVHDNILAWMKPLEQTITEEEAADLIGKAVGLTYLKESTWGNVGEILEDYKMFFDLTNYDEYLELKKDIRSEADIYIAKNNTYSSLEELDDILEEAIEEAKDSAEETKSKKGGSGDGGSSKGASYTVKAPVTETKPIVTDDLYNDIEEFENEKDAIAYMTHKGIVEGVAEKEFSPRSLLTREQFVKMLVLTFLKQDNSQKAFFGDVKESDWYYSYVATGVANNIIKGIGDDLFGVGRNITREEMVVLVYRTLVQSGYEFEISQTEETPKDENEISMWAVFQVKKLADMGVLNYNEQGNFVPKENVTRVEAVKLLYDVLMKTEIK